MAAMIRRQQLARTAAIGLVLSVLAGAPAWANTVNGAPAPAYTIKVQSPGSPVDILVDSADVGGPGSVGLSPVITPDSRIETAAIEVFNPGTTTITTRLFGRVVGAHNTYAGIWVNRTNGVLTPGSGQTSTVNIISDAMVQGSEFGIEVTGFCGANCVSQEMDTVNISGAFTGRVFGKTAVLARATNTINVNGFYQEGWDTGFFAQQDGINLSAATINIGQTSRLGTVRAVAGSGIIATGDTVRMTLSRVFSGGITGAGVSAISGQTGTTVIQFGAITSLGDGISVVRSGGSVGISGNNLAGALDPQTKVIAGRTGIRIDNPAGSPGARSAGFSELIYVTGISQISASQTGLWISQAAPSTSSEVQDRTVWVPTVGRIDAGVTGVRLSAYHINELGYRRDPIRPGFAQIFSPLGPITAGVVGIQVDPGALPASYFGAVTGHIAGITAGIGLLALNGDVNFDLNFYEAVTASLTGIYVFGGRGAVSLAGVRAPNASYNVSQVSGALDGIVVMRGSSAIGPYTFRVSGFSSISATAGDGIRFASFNSQYVTDMGTITAGRHGISATAGTITIDGVGSITAGQNGIDITAGQIVYIGTRPPADIPGNIANGTIIGQADGVRVIGASWTQPAFSMLSRNNVTGVNGTGIYHRGSYSTNLIIRSGTVTGGLAGIDIASTGVMTVTVEAGGTVRGATAAVISMPDIPQAWTASLINQGTIATTSPTSSGPGIAIATNGRVTVANTGTVTGRLSHNATAGFGTLSVSFQNNAGGTLNLYAGTSTFGGGADSLSNVGTINAPAGTTVLAGLESFVQGTGTISLQSWPLSADQLEIGGAFINLGGGRILINFDPDATSGPLDRGGRGNADTILAATTGVQGVTTIDVFATGGTNGAGAPLQLTGSVAVVSSGTAMPEPAAGATLVPSTNYVFGTGNPSTAARTFALVSDGTGGVFLQWVPVIGAGTIGGFGGGALGADSAASSGGGSAQGGALGFLQASLAGASQAAGRVADMTGFGAAFGGAGAAGAGCGSAAGASFSVRTGEWAGSGSQTASGATASGRDLAFSPGAGSDSCGRVSVGAFQFGGTASVGGAAGSQAALTAGTAAGDSARGSVQGAGGYLRADSGSGFYGQITAAAGSQRARVRNGIFGTLATVDTRLAMTDFTVGWARPVSDGLAVETRLSATRLTSTADPFRDSLGFEVTRLDTRADSLTATAGLLARTDSGGQGFVRAGIRTTDARMDGLAYGRRTRSADSATGRVLEAGWTQPLGDEASLAFTLQSDTGSLLDRQEVRVGYTVSW